MSSLLERRTFHHLRFADLGALRDAKERQGLAISVCIPTRNEGATIGPVADVIRRELVDGTPLVDQLVVVDGESEDATARVAADAGAEVFQEREILADLEPVGGKGEAMWASLFVTRGDIVVWVDADIVDFHPRFVYGLVGPLLEDPAVGFVKAFYDRPIARGDGTIDPTGGGRVTELVARPLLNMFWPELADVIQPLSGEYAGRRSVLEAVPFFTGYAVELGLLIDVAARFGMEAIAQVDLDSRTHRNRGIEDLSPMAFGIMQAAFQRLAPGREVGTHLRRFQRQAGEHEVSDTEVRIVERPPASSVAGYAR